MLRKYFPELNDSQISKFDLLQSLYPQWNEQINVISRKDIDSLMTKHVLHSLAIAKYVKFTPGTKIIDVGTGGGFPGIPLAIMFPQCEFTLVDSIGKKIKVVEDIAVKLDLKNVNATQARAEKIKQKYSFVVSRAVTAFPRFVALTRHLIDNKEMNSVSNGILYLKGGDFDDELEQFRKKTFVLNISDYFTESFFETKKLIHLTK